MKSLQWSNALLREANEMISVLSTLLSIMNFLKVSTGKTVIFLLERMWLHLNLHWENVRNFERKERLVIIRGLSQSAILLIFSLVHPGNLLKSVKILKKKNRNECFPQKVRVHRASLRIRQLFDAHCWWSSARHVANTFVLSLTFSRFARRRSFATCTLQDIRV